MTLDYRSSQELSPTVTRQRPCGYWLSASSSAAVQRLRQLGLQVMRVAEPGRLNADSYIASEPIGNSGQAVALKLTRGAIEADSGSYYVSLNQSHANLAAAALEPDTPFSYVNNGLLPDIGSVARVTAPPSVVFEDDAD